MANNGQPDFIEFVCKPAEDLYKKDERSADGASVKIKKDTEYRCSMLRDQHFSSLFRHYGKHNGLDKDTLVFFFTEELMQELQPSDTPRSVLLRKNDVIVIRHRHKEPQATRVRLDFGVDDALDLIRAYPKARSSVSYDGRTALHHVAARGLNPSLATQFLLLGCDPRTLDNYNRTALDIALQHDHQALADVLRPNEFKKQMAVIRAHFVNSRSNEGRGRAAEPVQVSRANSDLGLPINEFARSTDTLMTIVRAPHAVPAHVDAMSDDESYEANQPNLMKRPCSTKSLGSQHTTGEERHIGALRFLFSTLAHGNQARNFKRVVCFLYA